MGQQARLKATRRRIEADQRRANAAMANDPRWQAIAASYTDEECLALVARDAHGQRSRLTDDGWVNRERNRDGIGTWDHPGRGLRIIHSVAREQGGQVWGHVSVSHRSRTMPSWPLVRDAGWLMYPGRFGIVVVAPPASHVNLAEVAHVWYCLTGPSCPDFSHGLGTV